MFQSAPCESLGYLLKAGDNVFLPSDRETQFLLDDFPSIDLVTCVNFSLYRDIPEQEGQHEDNEWWAYVVPFVAIGPMAASIGHSSPFSPKDVLDMAKHPRCLQCNLLAYLPDSYKKWVPVEEVEGTCKIVSVDAQDSGNEDVKGVQTHGVFVGCISQEGDSNPTFEKVHCC
jgi:hypothetical protein